MVGGYTIKGIRECNRIKATGAQEEEYIMENIIIIGLSQWLAFLTLNFWVVKISSNDNF